MPRGNGKSEVEPDELDTTHELPASDATEESAPEAREAEMRKLREERDALLDRVARLQAEFENARRRATREQQEFREFALADALKALLPTLDNFELALRSAPPDKGDQFRSGVELIYKQLRDSLEKLGLRAVAAKGEQFDPRVHEAIEMVDTTHAADHEVLDELQHGYKLKERLLRPAMVRVARNPKH